MSLYDLTDKKEYKDSALIVYQSINNGENQGLGDFYYESAFKLYDSRYIHTPNSLGGWFSNDSEYDDKTAMLKQVDDYEKSIIEFQKANAVYERVLGKKYPKCKDIYYIVEQIKHEIVIFQKALEAEHSLETLKELW